MKQLPIAICMSLLLLNGCASIGFLSKKNTQTQMPDNSFIFASNDAEQKVDQEVITNIDADTQGASDSTTAFNNDVQLLVAEWKELAPDLRRLVSLQHDLEYALGELEVPSYEEVPVYEMDDTHVFSHLEEAEKDAEKNAKPAYEKENVQEVLAAKGDAENEVDAFAPSRKLNNLEVGQAPPILSKFSNKPSEITLEQAASSSMVSKALPREDAIDAKFSNVKYTAPPPPKVDAKSLALERSTECKAHTAGMTGSGKFAIHLASYSKMSSLNEGVATLRKSNENLFCRKLPVYKTLTVNNKQFYSLRLGPYNSKDEANKECEEYSRTNGYCSVTAFEGDQI